MNRKLNDDFYTQHPTLGDELNHYREKLSNKIVYCNCDDPTQSNFWNYFYTNFEKLNLKKLMSTHYEESTHLQSYDGKTLTRIPLLENGNFRSDESVDLLRESDFVVTNPPFSLFRLLC